MSVAQALEILPQQLVFGLTLGSIYALLALGYTMVYGILNMINFAHGDIFMIGSFVGWTVFSLFLSHHLIGLGPAVVLPTNCSAPWWSARLWAWRPSASCIGRCMHAG